MPKFKVGNRVKIIKDYLYGSRVGEIFIVESINGNFFSGTGEEGKYANWEEDQLEYACPFRAVIREVTNA